MKKRTKVFITMLMMVFVLGFTVNAESFRLSKDDVTLNTGDIMLIETYGTDVVPVWTSSNAKVAQVNAKGQVTALKAGTAEVTADVNGESKTCSVKVVNSSIKLNKTDAVIYTGKNPTTLKLKANVKGLSKDVTYKSTNPNVATVSADGTVTPVSAGQAKIIASANGQTTSCHVSVLKNRISLNVSSMVVSTKGAGASVKVTANVVGPKNKVKWTTSDKSVAAVSNGTVKGKGEGTAVITAEANGVKASCSVTVQPGFIAINEKQVTLYTDKPANAKKQLKSSATKKDSVVWASTNESVAKVDSKGLVTAVGAGTAYITLINDGNIDSCKINVMNVSTDITESSIALKTKGSDQTYMLGVKIIGKNKSVKWKSSDTKVATVNKGKVTGKKEGTAVITATANGVSDSVTVKVVPFDEVIDEGSGDDDKKDDDNHEHEWGDWEVIKEPSKTSEGLKVRKCTKCGKSEEMELSKVLPDGHVHEWSEWKVVSECDNSREDETTLGTRIRTCKTCGKLEQIDFQTDDDAPEHDHEWGDWETVLIRSGYAIQGRKCAKCYAYEQRYVKVEELEEDEEQETKPETKPEEKPDVTPDKHVHDWTDWKVVSECDNSREDETTLGTRIRTCKTCGKLEQIDFQTDDDAPEHDHVWSEWKTALIRSGYAIQGRKCAKCHAYEQRYVKVEELEEKEEEDKKEQETTPETKPEEKPDVTPEKHVHEWSEWKVVSECDNSREDETTLGTRIRTCKTCGKLEQIDFQTDDDAPEHDHVWSEWKTALIRSGYAIQGRKCAKCHAYEQRYVKVEELEEKEEEDKKEQETTPETKPEEKPDVTPEKHVHDWSDWEVVSECDNSREDETTLGTRIRTCKTCGKLEQIDFQTDDDAPEHDHVWSEWKTALIRSGYAIQGRKCAKCNAYEQRYVKVEELEEKTEEDSDNKSTVEESTVADEEVKETSETATDESTETAADTESSDDAADNKETVEDVESVEDVETVEEVETVEDVETVEEVETSEDIEATENIETEEQTEAA